MSRVKIKYVKNNKTDTIDYRIAKLLIDKKLAVLFEPDKDFSELVSSQEIKNKINKPAENLVTKQVDSKKEASKPSPWAAPVSKKVETVELPKGKKAKNADSKSDQEAD